MIPHQQVVPIVERDPISTPVKATGIGELGPCGLGAAGNAVYAVAGVRVRNDALLCDDLLNRLPVAA